MTARHLLSPQMLMIGAAAGALASAGPALAQTGPAPQTGYEYAQPAPPAPPPLVFRSDPVVQPVEVAPSVVAADETEYDYVEEAPPPPPLPVPMAPATTVHAVQPQVMVAGAPMAYGYPGAAYPGMPYPGGPYPPEAGWGPPQFDREAWLDDCRDRIRGHDRRERGGIIGGLLGAIGGGIIGNRAWRSERLAGTLIGAGVGGLAGLAIGSAIGAAGDRDRDDECALYLDRYLSDYQPGYPGYGYAYPAYTIAYVPVMVAVPQRAVVHEYVTTEWVDAPAPARTVVETKIIRQTAPSKYVPAKPSKYTKRR
jgi:hypothetical protein